jgi:pilus assembly protein CpaB|nr:hypothetical protein [Propionibacterium sp.]
MRRRGIIGILASILAVAGVVLLISYAVSADSRAIAGQQPTKVLVVTKDVPVGTAAKALAPFVEVRELPKAAVVAGTVTAVDQLAAENVASTTLKAGEQVLAARFVAPNSDDLTAQIAVPEGLSQLSIQLEPQRVVGSKLKAGDKIGIYVSLQVKGTDANATEVAVTHVLAHGVLVLRTQGATTPTASGTGDKAPTNDVIVTVAVNSALAERIVFAQEYGKVYLSQEKDAVNTDGTKIVNAGNVFNP